MIRSQPDVRGEGSKSLHQRLGEIRSYACAFVDPIVEVMRLVGLYVMEAHDYIREIFACFFCVEHRMASLKIQ
jgi:hypothetical protein